MPVTTYLPTTTTSTTAGTVTVQNNPYTTLQGGQYTPQLQGIGTYLQPGLQQVFGNTYQNVAFTWPVLAPRTKKDVASDSLGCLRRALENRMLDRLSSGVILGWMAANSPRHQKKMIRVARAVQESTGRIREFLETWEPGKGEA